MISLQKSLAPKSAGAEAASNKTAMLLSKAISLIPCRCGQERYKTRTHFSEEKPEATKDGGQTVFSNKHR